MVRGHPTGFTFDFNLIRLPVSDSDGYPIQTRGTAKYPWALLPRITLEHGDEARDVGKGLATTRTR
jgi:hypothetical protein